MDRVGYFVAATISSFCLALFLAGFGWEWLFPCGTWCIAGYFAGENLA